MTVHPRPSHSIPLIIAVALLIGIGIPGAAQAPEAEVRQATDAEVANVRTSLNDYLLAAEGGQLKSLYVHFVPLRTFLFPSPWPPKEVLAATTVDSENGDLERSFADDARFPFELVVDGASTADLAHDVEVERGQDRTTVALTAESGDLRIVKRFRFTNNPNYRFRTQLTLENVGESPVDLQDGLGLSLGTGVGEDPDLEAQSRFLIDGEIQDEADANEPIQGLGFEGNALTFFVSGFDAAEGWRARTSDGTLQAHLDALTLAPGESVSVNLKAVGGRTKHMLLQAEGLGDLARPGFFGQFVVYVGEMLNWFFAWTGNYGWAIILFTLVTRILLFPLMRKQFHSMSAMGELRPEMEKLQQRYPTRKKLQELHPNISQDELTKRDRENRQKLQQKTMELYREHGVNPLSGCLPMLVQFPILILLYRAIIENAESIHLSPGFLWMPDLAMQDPTWIIMILTVSTLLLQSKTNPMQSSSPQSAGQQNAMMVFMGGFMLVALHNFPAGLWMYYFLTNVVQVSQQLFVKWEINQEKAKRAATAEAQTSETSEAEADADAAVDPERLDPTPEMPEATNPNNPDGDDADADRPAS